MFLWLSKLKFLASGSGSSKNHLGPSGSGSSQKHLAPGGSGSLRAAPALVKKHLL